MDYTYEQYCADLDSLASEELTEGFLDALKGVRGKIGKIIALAKKTFSDIADETTLTLKDIIKAFKTKDVFKVLKAFGFSIRKILTAINKATLLINKGILNVFNELHKTKVMQKIKQGAMTVDDVLNKYPILNRIGGAVVAGLLMYIWLNMTFVGNFDYDMDIGAMADALLGNYSIHDLFISPAGNTMLLFLATGILSGGALSVAWLGHTGANLALAISYAGLKRAKANPKVLEKIRGVMRKQEVVEDRELLTFKQYISI